jgi:hypothetical protein
MHIRHVTTEKLLQEALAEVQSSGDPALDTVLARVKLLAPNANLPQDIIDDYIDELEDGFEPAAYENISDEDLIKDIQLYAKHRGDDTPAADVPPIVVTPGVPKDNSSLSY